MKYLTISMLRVPLMFLILASGCRHPGVSGSASADSTTIPYQHVSLKDTAEFNYSDPRHSNWSVASKVFSDRNVTHSLEATPGTGILLSRPTGTDKAELLTKFKHGDIDLELDFMMPKGSNSGIYLMGRYEVQLFDSWLKPKDSLHFGDCGGIYERMAGGRGYEGRAPDLNACKAPGLWQHLKVRFRAPRFDAAGKKIANACFLYVYLNGALVQQNVEASLPTLGSYYSNEAPTGPLEIQGSHGPIAIRDIRYRTYINGRIRLKDMELKVYKSLYRNIDTLKTLVPDRILHPDSLSQRSYLKYEQGIYHGTMEIPADGDYIFKLQAGGPSWLWIDSALVVENHASGDYFTPWYGRVHLAGGTHTFSLIYNNRYQQFKLSYEGTGVPETVLTTVSSEFPEPKPEPYVIVVGNHAVVQRGFIMHQGVKRTHAIMVGLSGGINYAYSLAGYYVLSVWRGRFIDAADMWRERGEQQLAQPLGGLTEMLRFPSVETLKNSSDPWVDSIPVDSAVYSHRSYRLNTDGSPVFNYTYKQAQVQDYIHRDSSGQGLIRKMTVTIAPGQDRYFVMLARGGPIRHLPNGDFAVHDANFYITHVTPEGSARILRQKGYDELVCSLQPGRTKTVIQYEIIW